MDQIIWFAGMLIVVAVVGVLLCNSSDDLPPPVTYDISYCEKHCVNCDVYLSPAPDRDICLKCYDGQPKY